MKFSIKKVLFLSCAISTSVFAADAVVWEMNSLSKVGGNDVIKRGTPKVVETTMGNAVEFNAKPDQLLVLNNPLGSATEWTIEVIINPYSIGSDENLKEPRFLHVQDSVDKEKRITMEMRVGSDDKWYFDGYVRASSTNNLTLKDSKLTHPVNEWYNTTITYKDKKFTTYINGKKELEGAVTYEPINSKGRVSLGSRMDTINYFKGAIKKVIVTNAALTPDKFDKSYISTSAEESLQQIRKFATKSNSVKPVMVLDETVLSEKVFTLTGRAIRAEKSLPVISNGMVIGVDRK